MSGPPDRLAFLTERPFAHRGLHGGGLHGRGLAENGMAAFAAAKAGGFGIECDVRASADGVAMVFHDASLQRMAGRGEAIEALEAEALSKVALPDGGTIPTLAALLDHCGGAVPLLIEIKADGRRVAPLCAAVARELDARPSARAAIMSFNPVAVRWFARAMPGIVRGLVVTQRGEHRLRGAAKRALALWWARPDFLACDIRDLPSAFAARAHARGVPVLTWTVRSAAGRDRAAAHADQIIFEHGDG